MITSNGYSSVEWKAYRSACLEKVGHRCEICHRDCKSVCLQVHHPHYNNIAMPWEYSMDFVQVICKGCHAVEHGIIKPLSGWTLIRSDWEEGEPSGETWCAHCGTSMKWHNDLYHCDWGVITVGYDCAAKLGNRKAWELRKLYLAARTFVNSPRWKRTSRGYIYKSKRVFILKRNETDYRLKIRGQWGRMRYGTLDDAKRKSFEVLAKDIVNLT